MAKLMPWTKYVLQQHKNVHLHQFFYKQGWNSTNFKIPGFHLISFLPACISFKRMTTNLKGNEKLL